MTSKCHNEEFEMSEFMIAARHKRTVRKLSDCSLIRIARVIDAILCHMTSDELRNFYHINRNTANAIMKPLASGKQLSPDALSFVEENEVICDLIEDMLLRRGITIAEIKKS